MILDLPKSAGKRNGKTRERLFDLVVIGGFGHVGLPLAVAFAAAGAKVCAYDIDEAAAQKLRRFSMPFIEANCEHELRSAVEKGNLTISLDRDDVSRADMVIIIVGTPVDRHLNPDFEAMQNLLDSYMDCLVDGQTLVLRSTVYPGTTEKIAQWIKDRGRGIHIAFCPERIAEGKALEELSSLPQIVSGCSPQAVHNAEKLFGCVASEVLILEPIEAELAKLFNNAWRYMQFAAANQFFMIANDHNADFHRIHHAMTHNYPRAKSMPGAGFAAGPCLFKDTMQLAAFNNNNFSLGHAAMLINEGLPNYIVNRLKQKHRLRCLSVGILGMAFKADIDDPRESLSYKLRKILAIECAQVLCSDAYICDPAFVSTQELLDRCDIVILATPHNDYHALAIPAGKTVVDVWNVWGRGSGL